MEKNDSLTIKRVSLVDAVMEQMEAAVQSGRFKLGDKIPSEKVLAQEFGVSRATLREAFKRLENSGMLDIRQGDGTYLQSSGLDVGPLQYVEEQRLAGSEAGKTDATETKQTNVSPYKGPLSLSDYLDAREALESEAAELAALRATEEDIVRLEKIVKMQEQLLDEPLLFEDMDMLFHSAIIDIADSRLISDFWHKMYPIIREQTKKSALIPGVTRNAYAAHKEIVSLIKNKAEGNLLHSAIVDHIRMVPGRLFFSR